MTTETKQHGPGMIGLASGGSLRSDDYPGALVALQKPPGTMFHKVTGLGPANPFNAIGVEFMKRKHLQWLLLTNDDNLFPSDGLMRMLDRNVDVCTGLYLSRIQPFEPVIFDSYSWNESGLGGERERWYNRRFIEPGEKGLIPIVACGDGFLLIRRHVLEGMAYPWWEYGMTLPDACDHDMFFSMKVGEAGFHMWCDLDVRVDHVTQAVVRPHRAQDGTWSTHLVQADRVIGVPMASMTMAPKGGRRDV
jgi:hypothetical protein